MHPTGFKYSYETSHGIHGEATGAVKQVGEETPVIHQGSYAYTSEGKTYTVNYVADENGYQATVSYFLECFFFIQFSHINSRIKLKIYLYFHREHICQLAQLSQKPSQEPWISSLNTKHHNNK